MNKIVFFVMVILLITSFVWGENTKVLVLLPHNFGANFCLFMEVFEQMGFEVTITGLTTVVQPCASYAAVHGVQPVTVEFLTSEITDVSIYDCVAVMSSTQYGGNDPCADIMNDIYSLLIVYTAEEQNKAIWATCSGVRMLAAAGVIEGCNVTGAAAFSNEYTYAGANFVGGQLPPVVDGNIITTTRGQYYMHQNSEVILSVLAELENNTRAGGAE